MNLALLGYGRMGREVEAAAAERGHDVVARLDVGDNAGGSGITEASFADVDAAIDFSQASAVLTNVERTTGVGVPMVIGTTGWHEHLEAIRAMVVERGGSIVYGANFSVGANLFFRAVQQAAQMFDGFDEYDPYILEHHHRGKTDAPSGTALRLADIVTGASAAKHTIQAGNPTADIDANALHVASVRAGGAFGEHTVGFDGDADAIRLVHTARSRRGFARGAVMAAEWLQDHTGMHEFGDVLDDVLER